MAASITASLNPHYDAKRDSGTGIGVSLAMKPVSNSNVELSANYLTGTHQDDRSFADVRIGTSIGISGPLSAIAEVGYGAASMDGHWSSNLMPVALGLSAGDDNLAVQVKAQRFLNDGSRQDVQWLASLKKGF